MATGWIAVPMLVGTMLMGTRPARWQRSLCVAAAIQMTAGGALAALVLASTAAHGVRRFVVLPGAFGRHRVVAPPHSPYGRQRLYPAVPLPESEYGPSFQPLPLPLPGNIIVEVPTPGPARPVTARLDKIRDVGPYLTACWHAPGRGSGRGVRQVTLRTGFKRNGALIGPPRMTFSDPPRTSDVQRAFVAGSIAAFQRCTPLPLTIGFGNAIAGVPFAIRFRDIAG